MRLSRAPLILLAAAAAAGCAESDAEGLDAAVEETVREIKPADETWEDMDRDHLLVVASELSERLREAHEAYEAGTLDAPPAAAERWRELHAELDTEIHTIHRDDEAAWPTAPLIELTSEADALLEEAGLIEPGPSGRFGER